VSTGSLRQDDYKTLSACQNKCVQNDACVAVDFVTSGGGQCWEHTSSENLAPHNTTTGVSDVTQYRLDRTCPTRRGTTPTGTRGLSLLLPRKNQQVSLPAALVSK